MATDQAMRHKELFRALLDGELPHAHLGLGLLGRDDHLENGRTDNDHRHDQHHHSDDRSDGYAITHNGSGQRSHELRTVETILFIAPVLLLGVEQAFVQLLLVPTVGQA